MENGVPVPDLDHDVVGGTGNEAEVVLFEKGVEPIATGIGQGDCFPDVVGIGKAGEGGDLRGSGGVEGLPGFLKNGGDLGAGETVADAKGGKALDLGEGAKDDDGTALFDPGDGGGRFRNELVIRLVQDEKGPGGKFFNKGGELRVGDAGAGGVVGRGEEHEANIVPEAGGEPGEVVMKIAVGHLLKRNSKEAGHQAVDGESVGGGQNAALAGVGVGVVAEFDDFVGATAENDVIRGEAVGAGDGFAEGDSRTIGIEVGMLEGVADGLEGAGGGAERVFVRGEFCDLGWLEAVFSGDIGDGPPGLVGPEVGHMGVGDGKLHGFCGTERVWRVRKSWRARLIFGLRGARHAAAKRAALICPARPAAKKGPGAEAPSLRRRARVGAGWVESGTSSGGTDRPTFPGM